MKVCLVGRIMAFACVLLLAVSPASAQPVQTDGLRSLQDLDQKVLDIGSRLASAGAPICPETWQAAGLTLHSAAQYSPRFRSAAIEAFGFKDGFPKVLALAKGGAADIAGLRQGDTVLGVDGRGLDPDPFPVRGRESYDSVDRAMILLETLPADRAAEINLERDGRRLAIPLTSRKVCKSRMELVPGDKINASSNGNVVQIFGKLAIWTKSDDELAIVIAHEMAHNILDHNEQIAQKRIGTGLLASFGRDGKRLRDFERQADHFGLYLVALAGYDYTAAPDFWYRLSQTSGLGAIWATSHPTAGNRSRYNAEFVAEIQAKKQAGQAVAP